MASNTAGRFPSLPDPYWTVGDYIRLADHPSADVRLWALERLDELGSEVPEDILRRRLGDADLLVATVAAELVGRLGVTSLADVLHARLERTLLSRRGSSCSWPGSSRKAPRPAPRVPCSSRERGWLMGGA